MAIEPLISVADNTTEAIAEHVNQFVDLETGGRNAPSTRVVDSTTDHVMVMQQNDATNGLIAQFKAGSTPIAEITKNGVTMQALTMAGGTATISFLHANSLTLGDLSTVSIEATGTITANALAVGAVTSRMYDQGAVFINVKAYGVGGDPATVGNDQGIPTGGAGGIAGLSYDSYAFRAAIVDLQAKARAWGARRTVILLIPAGQYNVSETVNLAGYSGLEVSGSGKLATVITPIGSAAYWAGKPVIDTTGSHNLHLHDLGIECDSITGSLNQDIATGVVVPAGTVGSATYGIGDPNAIIPQVGLLAAQNDPAFFWINTPGNTDLPADSSNANFYESIRINGSFKKAAHVNFAVASSLYVRCDFYNTYSWNASYPNGVYSAPATTCATVVFTRDNQIGAVAGQTPVPLIDLTHADGRSFTSMSDITMIDCEIHDQCGQTEKRPWPGGQCSCPALWLDEAYDIRILGGNISGHISTAFVFLTMGVPRVPAPVIGPRNITFDGTTFYGEGSGAVTPNAFSVRDNVNSNAGLVAVTDFVSRNQYLAVTTGGAVFTGAASATLTRFRVENLRCLDAAWMVNWTAGTATPVSCSFDFGGTMGLTGCAASTGGGIYANVNASAGISNGYGTAVLLGISSHALTLGNGQALWFRNAGNSANISALAIDGSNNLRIGDGNSTSMIVNASTTLNLQVAGSDRLIVTATATGFNGHAAAAPPALPANATDLTTTEALANAIKTLLIGNGLAT